MVAHPKSQRAKRLNEQRKKDRVKRASAESVAAKPSPKKAVVDTGGARQRRRQRMRRRTQLVSAGVIGAVALLAFFLLRPGPELPGVERPDNEGRGHVAGATYGSAAPTSGQHNSAAPRCGVYSSPLAADLAVHALEHGTVVFWYDPARPELASELAGIVDQFDSHVIVSPNIGLASPVVATAWNRRLALDSVGEEALSFASTYRRRGPERIPCDIA